MSSLIVWQNGVPTEVTFDAPAKLDDVLHRESIYSRAPCGGRGICGKCRVVVAGCVSPPDLLEQQLETRLSCRTVLLGDSQVWLCQEAPITQIALSGETETELHPPLGEIGAAVDVGTTTLALKLYDLKTGGCIGQSSMENPQLCVAADVMGRIQAALEGKGEHLRCQVINALETMIEDACTNADISSKQVDVLSIVGNTTMLYLLTGQRPGCLAVAPFHADDLFGREMQVLDRRSYLPHCMNAFVGADITSAVLSSGMCESKEIALLCDIGTNGELALWNDDVLYVSSTAAGPAFEGAGISCGCNSIPGAVDKVWQENGKICTHTIQNRSPVGMCGSGLLDAISVCLQLELIDETGAMQEETLGICDGVSLSRKDVRAVQLAKAAIAAGIETIATEAGIKVESIQRLYIAGGFGSHINIENAVAIGMIPSVLKNKVTVLGNAALSGAAQMLLNQSMQHRACDIAKASKHVNLGGNKIFNHWFMEKMFFD